MHSEDPEAQIPMWGYVLTAFGILLFTVGAMIGLFRPEMLIAANAEISVFMIGGYKLSRVAVNQRTSRSSW